MRTSYNKLVDRLSKYIVPIFVMFVALYVTFAQFRLHDQSDTQFSVGGSHIAVAPMTNPWASDEDVGICHIYTGAVFPLEKNPDKTGRLFISIETSGNTTQTSNSAVELVVRSMGEESKNISVVGVTAGEKAFFVEKADTSNGMDEQVFRFSLTDTQFFISSLTTEKEFSIGVDTGNEPITMNSDQLTVALSHSEGCRDLMLSANEHYAAAIQN